MSGAGSVTVQYATAGYGAPGAWSAESEPTQVSGNSCVTEYNYIWCAAAWDSGGTSTVNVYHAQIPSGGGAPYNWVTQTYNTVAVAGAYAGCVLYNGLYIYCMGGGTGSPYETVQYAYI
jgi:hypothetical protein